MTDTRSEIQAILKARGYSLGSSGPNRDGIDGKPGDLTFAAVLAELKKAPLPVTVAAPSDEIERLATIHLRREEGVIPYAYQDHLSFWTIGVGRLIDKRKGGRLTDAEINLLLANDIASKRAQLASDPDTAAAWSRVKGDPVRAVALLSMGFQMGVGAAGKDDAGLSGFDASLALVAAGRFADAAAALLKSLWARQTPERAERVADMLRTGKLA
jgi:lysozyme